VTSSSKRKQRDYKPLPNHRLHEEEAGHLGCSPRTLHRKCETGLGPPRFLFCGRWQYPNDGTEKYIRSLAESA
jgi:hypothetical protein